MVMATDRPTLTLAELESCDPHASSHGRERRFLCPLSACADKPRDTSHRSLALDTDSGAWFCHRCQAAGVLKERWVDRPRAQQAQAALRRAYSVSTPPPVLLETEQQEWRAVFERAATVVGTPGGQYLVGRGIPEVLAAAAGVRYTSDWFGSPAVLFGVHDRAGQLVAVAGRYLSPTAEPKARTAGRISLGVWAGPGALDAPYLVVCEAPIDALSLTACGVPAVALCGVHAPAWLPTHAAFRRVALALDADKAGDDATGKLAPQFSALSAQVERWRPAVGKDWNEVLQAWGPSALRHALAEESTLPAGSPPPGTDPRPDLPEDSSRWSDVLILAYAVDAGDVDGLFGPLLGFRCLGARLETTARGGRLLAGEIEPEEYAATREEWLVPRQRVLASVLRCLRPRPAEKSGQS